MMEVVLGGGINSRRMSKYYFFCVSPGGYPDTNHTISSRVGEAKRSVLVHRIRIPTSLDLICPGTLPVC